MKRDLKGKRLLITGASSGIGRSLAEKALRRGARLALTARSAERLGDLVTALTATGGEAVAITGDITSDDDRQRIVAAAVERLGGLDILINCAGVGSFGHFADSSEEVLRQIMEVNFFAPTEMIRLCIPHLTQGNQAAIVNVGSMTGRRGVPGWSEYSASKFGLTGMSEALRGEMARFDIDVLLVLPGLTQTSLKNNLLQNKGRMKIEFEKGMPADYVAEQILRSLERNQREVVLGWEARLILLLNRFAPRFLDWRLDKLVRKLWVEQPAKEVRENPMPNQ